jgi:peptidoglycan/LPS O-acetylase OafA/YrhL
MVREHAFINLFRALAALWVVAAHCMIWGGWYGLPLPSAKIAVDLFMMISGYLMVANAAARERTEPLGSPGNWWRFWLRRFFRLAPAYYVSLAIAVLGSGWFLEGYGNLQALDPARWPPGGVYDPASIVHTPTSILLHLSFLFGLLPSYAFSTFLPDWSLSLEMQFYAVFPLFMLLAGKVGIVRATTYAGLPAIVVAIIVSRLVRYPEPSLLLLKVNYFLAGMLLCAALDTQTDRRRRCLTALYAVALVSLDLRYRHELWVLPALWLSMWGLATLERAGRMPRWLASLVRSAAVRFASDTSYGLYLFHGFFISAAGLMLAAHPQMQQWPPPLRVLALFGFVAVAAYLCAYVVHRAVELPGIRLGRTLIRRIPPTPVSPPAALVGDVRR